MTLEGRIAVVTGASGGVGREIAVSLARAGAALVLVARDARSLEAVGSTIEQTGGRALVAPADVSETAGVEDLRSRVERELGPPTILVNAAGVFGPLSTIRASDPRPWIQTLAVNTIGPYLTCRAFAAGMVEVGWGRIVNVTSANSLHPPGMINAAYATSKVALNQLTRHLALELEGTGVTANVIHPGDVKTEMWAWIRDEIATLGPEAQPLRDWVAWVEETGGDPPAKAADLVLRLVADDSAAVTGRFLWIDNPLQAPIPSWGDADLPLPWEAP